MAHPRTTEVAFLQNAFLFSFNTQGFAPDCYAMPRRGNTPKNVTRTALQNAASIAGLLLTTEYLITELPEKDKPAPAGGGHGGHGRGGMDY